MSEPMELDGLRRVCFREPGSGTVVEIMEDGPALPGGVRPRFYELAPAVIYAALSVSDLGAARAFFVDALGLPEEPAVELHPAGSDALWGLDGARRRSFVVRAQDRYVEVCQYEAPASRPKRSGALLSDQGMMNVALGYRRPEPLAAAYGRLTQAGYRTNVQPPTSTGAAYMLDGEGNSLELLLTPREFDDSFGFEPRPAFHRPALWPTAPPP